MYNLLLTEHECRALEAKLHIEIQKDYFGNPDFHKLQRDYDTMSISDPKREDVEAYFDILTVWRKLASIVIAMDLDQFDRITKQKRS